MNAFFRELWHDLRAKRLWPVAALLVVGLVAVPVVLKKHSTSGSTGAPTPAAASGSAADSSKAVVVADTGTVHSSTLGVFNKKDPFKPDKATLAAAHPKPVAQKQATSSQPQSSSPSGASQPSGGPSGQPSGGSTGGAPTTPKPTKPKGPYAYTVDVKFGKFGQERIHHNVQKLDVLPNQNNPLVVFLGVNSAGDTAVFLTDTSLKAAGEGTCKPNGDTCSFLYLQLDKNKNSEDLSEQAADGSGTEYTLKLVAIHKVLVSELAKGAKKASKAARQAALRARKLHHKSPTAFKVPFGLQLQPDQVP